MPCNSDYMEPSDCEVLYSKIAYMIDEVVFGARVNPKTFSNGIHPKVYNKNLSKSEKDLLVQTLCFYLTNAPDVSKFSLEVQLWWRDHQEADRERLERESSIDSKMMLIRSALGKLSPEEITALGIDHLKTQL